MVSPIGAFIHEVGHLIGALLVKADRVELLLGIGKKIGSLNYGSLVIHIHAVLFLGGLAKSSRNTPFNKKELCFITFCGPLFNLLVAYAVTMIPLNNKYIFLFIIYNIWIGVINLVPFKVNGKQSDGYTIFGIIKNRYVINQ